MDRLLFHRPFAWTTAGISIRRCNVSASSPGNKSQPPQLRTVWYPDAHSHGPVAMNVFHDASLAMNVFGFPHDDAHDDFF